MSSSSTLYNTNHHNHSNGINHQSNNGTTSHIINVSHSNSGMQQQQHRNSPLANNNTNNSFIYTSQSSLAPSPTISLISSSSSSPTSSSSSPTQLTYNSSGNKSNSSNIIFGNNSSNISAAKKTAALQSIAASIARSQQLSAMNNNTNNNQQMYGQPNTHQNSNLANKILALTLENNGVASSIVKSNTNIYYNSKVDTAASKAIHYCTQCSNSDCKAIHKSLTKPLNHNNHHGNGNVNLSQSQSLPTPLMSQPLSNVKNGSPVSNTPTSSQQQQLARKFLTSKLEQLDKQTKLANQSPMLPKTPIDQTKHIDTQSQQSNQFNKLLGANVNFIFERRYPLVQLNSNFFNISASNPNGGSTESLINFINNAGQSSLLSPMTTSALLSGSNLNNHSSSRNILQYRGGNHGSQNLFSDDDNNLTSSISSPSVSPKGTSSFPLPISPPSSHFDPIKSPPKSTSFSINVNNNSQSQNNISPPSNTSSPSSISSSSLTSLPNASNNLLQKQTDEVNNIEMTDSFPSLNRLDNLRYKNIMFLDQVRFPF